MNQTSPILDPALDVAAPTQELWLAGKTAFQNAIDSNSVDWETAYYETETITALASAIPQAARKSASVALPKYTSRPARRWAGTT